MPKEISDNLAFDWEGLSPDDYSRLKAYYADLDDPDATSKFAWNADNQLFVFANGLKYDICTIFDDAIGEPVLRLRLENPFANPRDKTNLSKSYIEMERSLLRKKDYAAFQKSIERYIRDDVANGIRNGRISSEILQARTQREAEQAIAVAQDV